MTIAAGKIISPGYKLVVGADQTERWDLVPGIELIYTGYLAEGVTFGLSYPI